MSSIEFQKLKPIEGLGTLWFFEVEKGREAGIAEELKRIITQFNQNYSRFDKNSLVSQLNNSREISTNNPEFLDLLRLGNIYYTKSNSIFNFLLENQLTNLGYDKDYSFQEKNRDLELPSPKKDLIIDGNKIILKKGGIDFGGFGKGYLVNKISKILQSEFQLSNFVINAGGDIFCHSTQLQTFHLQHPTQKSKSIGTIQISNGSIASSSTFLRNWNNCTGQNKNHLIDPVTQDSIKPAAVYVVCKNPVEADMWATTISIASQSQVESFQSKYGFEYLKINQAGISHSKNFSTSKPTQ